MSAAAWNEETSPRTRTHPRRSQMTSKVWKRLAYRFVVIDNRYQRASVCHGCLRGVQISKTQSFAITKDSGGPLSSHEQSSKQIGARSRRVGHLLAGSINERQPQVYYAKVLFLKGVLNCTLP